KGKGKGKEQEEEEEEEGEIILSLPSLPPSPPSPVSTLCINFPQGLSLSIPLSSLSSSPLIGTPSLSMIYVDLSISLSSPLASFISTETISILRACGCIRTDQFEMEQESKLLIDRENVWKKKEREAVEIVSYDETKQHEGEGGEEEGRGADEVAKKVKSSKEKDNGKTGKPKKLSKQEEEELKKKEEEAEEKRRRGEIEERRGGKQEERRGRESCLWY
ncbi:hypothetical protein ADUPG1_006955, partial [Aduncisulcus paluster]